MIVQGLKVAVVDDDTLLSKMLSEKFAQSGAIVSVANSCTEGIEMITKMVPDIAVVDLLMPDSSGFELVRSIQKSGGSQPFFVILTDSINANQVAEAIETGVTTYLQKAEHNPEDIVKIVGERYAATKPKSL